MNPRHLRFVAALLGLLLVVCFVAVPVFAVEGDDGNGTIVFPTDPAPPTPTPTPTPTLEPTPTPTPEPTPAPTAAPTPAEQPDDPDEPGSEATPAPQGGGTTNKTTPRPGASSKPGSTSTPSPIQNPNMQRPQVDLNTTPTMAPTGPNYVTFAQLNLKNNSMSATLFYLGICSALLGTAGIAVMIVLALRRRRAVDSREDIFIEIEEAESRHAPISATPELIVSPPAHKAISYDPMFTESGRFEAQEEPLPASRYAHEQLEPIEIAPPVQARRGQNAPIVPVAADLYTDEFPLEELEAQAEQAEEPPAPELEVEQPAPPPVRPLASRLRQRQGQPRPVEAEEEKPPKPQEAAPQPQPPETPEQEAATRVIEPVRQPPKQAAPQPAEQPEDATQEVRVPVKKPKKSKAKEPPVEQRTTEWPAVKPEKACKKPPNSPEQLSLLGTFEQQEPAGQEKKAPARPEAVGREPDQISFF